MPQRLFLLDGMALVYRAHFAFMSRPIRTSAGLNTSALFGFANTLLDIIQTGEPTHLAVVFDTDAPTPRHEIFPEYKAQREAMPEELSAALPQVRRLAEAFGIPVLSLDGYEADDLIGTWVRHAEAEGFESFMVTPDKDFGQLVTDRILLWKPGRQGSDREILGPAEVCARWGIARPAQVIDMLALMGDTTDNIPGVPGIGEKTAAKLLAEYDTVEGVLANADKVKGRVGAALVAHREDALLSKKLATIRTDAPLDRSLEELKIQPRNDAAVQAICVEFEFNTLGRRLFGQDFKAGRGFASSARTTPPAPEGSEGGAQGDLFGGAAKPAGKGRRGRAAAAVEAPAAEAGPRPSLQSLKDVPHDYRVACDAGALSALASELSAQKAFALALETDSEDPRVATVRGMAFSYGAGSAWFVPWPDSGSSGVPDEMAPFAAALANPAIVKVGHNLKFALRVLSRQGIPVRGPLFDTMIAHAVAEPDLRHGFEFLSESLLGYSPSPLAALAPEVSSGAGPVPAAAAERRMEQADIVWRLRERLKRLLKERGQERVFNEVEMPVLPALAQMELEGIRVDAAALAEFSRALAEEMAAAESDIHRLAGRVFNVNSGRQLGEVLFDQLRLVERPKKTPTGQYATDEQTLQTLAGEHLIVRRLLDYRAVSKLKSTYADALPLAIFPPTGRVHTTLHQAATATGRLSSMDPNLQNIPIRSERGQEIRRAFVPREGWKLLSADYSQIELRIIASLGREAAMIEAFQKGEDIHASTAARVFGVPLGEVTFEMRRRAKMVNFGIAYGISAFGLAQRLGIPRAEAAAIIQQYFASFPGIREYMEATIRGAREKGYVETVTGRRRYVPEVNSANGTIRGAAERNAINAPIQGTAADMIKIAMARIHEGIEQRQLRSRMLLQVHDELVFELYPPEEAELRELMEDRMKNALPLPVEVPIEIEIGTGANWLEAH